MDMALNRSRSPVYEPDNSRHLEEAVSRVLRKEVRFLDVAVRTAPPLKTGLFSVTSVARRVGAPAEEVCSIAARCNRIIFWYPRGEKVPSGIGLGHRSDGIATIRLCGNSGLSAYTRHPSSKSSSDDYQVLLPRQCNE